MFNANGTYYTEEHTVSFGTVSNGTFTEVANTWNDWHLIPSSKPVISNPTFEPKLIEVPGSDFPIDLTNYLKVNPVYGMLSGSFSFYVDNHENWESIRQKITSAIHGRELYMRLDDEPNYAYKGRFTVGNWQPGASYSSITIEYKLDPNPVSIS